jgi:hypothetical protein
VRRADARSASIVTCALTRRSVRSVGGRQSIVLWFEEWSVPPELFEAFEPPMSFPTSRRSNEEKVNAKEVR